MFFQGGGALAEWLLGPSLSVLGAQMSLLEVGAALLTLLSVLMLAHARPGGWLVMIAASLGYGVLFVVSRLYGQAALQLMFVVIALHGWWQWRVQATAGRASECAQPLPIRSTSPKVAALALAVAIVGAALLAWVLAANTDSPLPWADAGLTAASLVAQTLQALRYLSNWPAWIMINLASSLLFADRALWATAGLYALLALLSVQGWYQWHRAWQLQAQALPRSSARQPNA